MRFDTLQTPAGSGKLSDRQSYIKFIETYYFRKFVNNVLTLKQYDFLLYFLSKSVEFIHFVSWFQVSRKM